MGQRDRQPGLRHRGRGHRRGLHLGGNSRENRLTPFANDPVSEPTGEAIYLRDEDTGEVWAPTPGPVPRTAESGRCVVRHRAGVSRFAHASHGIEQELAVFVDAERAGEVLAAHAHQPQRPAPAAERLRLQRVGAGPAARRRAPARGHRAGPGVGRDPRAQPYNQEFARASRSRASSEAPHSVTGDRLDFLGRNGSLARPARLTRHALSATRRRRPRPVRRAPGPDRPRAGRDAPDRLLARPGARSRARARTAGASPERRRGRGRARRRSRAPGTRRSGRSRCERRTTPST